jgi:hypothetical protein
MACPIRAAAGSGWQLVVGPRVETLPFSLKVPLTLPEPCTNGLNLFPAAPEITKAQRQKLFTSSDSWQAILQ